MKLKLISLFSIVLLSGCCSWCIPQNIKDSTQQNAELLDAFVVLMESGKTTRENEQEFIRTNRRCWHSHNYVLNDVPLPADVATWYHENQPGKEDK